MTLIRYGPTDEHVPYVEAQIEEAFRKQDQASVFVRRGQLTESDVERGVTEMLLVEDTGTADANADFGGILKDINREGSTTEFILESFERYARDAPPTRGDERFEAADDSTIVNDAVSGVSQLSAGTVDTLDNSLTMVFSHSSQAKKIREIEKATAGEVKYRPDKTVDYVDSLGSDKTGTTLSPQNQNITDDFNADKKGGDEDVTHLRVIGAGEGRSQVTVNLVPSADSTDYENDPDYQNVVRYTASHWSSGDRKEWQVRSNKDHTSVDALSSVGQSYIDDVQTTHVEAFASIQSRTGIEVNLGDEFTVQYPEEEINDALRVIKLTTKIDSTGYTYDADLSTRQISVEDGGSEERKDLDRYNMAFEGTNVTMTTGGGRQPVNADNNYEFSFYYPDEVNYEHRLDLFVKGLNYRAYSQGAAAGGEHTHSVEVTHPSHSHTIEAAEFNHSHNISTSRVSASSHPHGNGTLGTASHPHGNGTLGVALHPHTNGTLGVALHPHTNGTLGVALHPHGDGTLGVAGHGHGDGTLGVQFHGHDDGTLGVQFHGHDDGTLGVDGHGHDNGSLGVNSHDHPNSIFTTSENNNEFGTSVAGDGIGAVDFVGDTNGNWQEIDSLDISTDYSMGVVHVTATAPQNVVYVRARDSSEVGESDFGSIATVTPHPEGTVLNGTSDSSPSSSTNLTLLIPDDWGFIDVDVKTPSGAANANFNVGYHLLDLHDHGVDITEGTDNRSPSVNSGFTGDDAPNVNTGDTGDDAPNVNTGDTGDDAPNVNSGSTGSDSPNVSSGNTGDSSPDVNSGNTGDSSPNVNSGDTGDSSPNVNSGDTDSTSPDVNTGQTGSTGPPVSGVSDSNNDIQTSTTELGTSETATTPPTEGGHQHDPESGIIEFTNDLPQNCDVLVNGQSVGVSLGDGSTAFEEQVSLEGLLNAGQVNTIEITSDALGHIQAHLSIDVYRQILGSG